MRVAFYAPLKQLDHPAPSGDRRMARALHGLLASAGHETEIACRLRSYDRNGDGERQERLTALGAGLAGRLAARLEARPPDRRPDAWLTYHVYHKAPDHLGPYVTRALGIPYLVAEASLAAKQANGPWATGYAASLQSFASADVVLAMTENDRRGLAAIVRPPAQLVLFPPFLDTLPFERACEDRARHRAALAARLGLDARQPWLLTIAMMRDDVKRRSYGVLAEALALLGGLEWQLVVVGDGPARDAVVGELTRVAAGRLHAIGAVPPEALPEICVSADLFVWPALREAYGMAILEAQASGLPVVVGAEGGVPEIVRDGITGLLCQGGDPADVARNVRTLLADPTRRRAMGQAAQCHVRLCHGTAAASDRLDQALAAARSIRAGRPAMSG